MPPGESLGDGSCQKFQVGFFSGHKFLFFFASKEDLRDLYGERFEILFQIHEVKEETVNKDDTRAMWNILAENLASSRKRFIDFDQDVMHEKG